MPNDQDHNAARRRSRRKDTVTPAEQTAAAIQDATPTASATEAVDAAAPATRRRASRAAKSASAATAAQATAPASASAPSAPPDDPATFAPKRRPARRASAAQQTVEAPEPVIIAPSQLDTTETPASAPAPASRAGRRGRVRGASAAQPEVLAAAAAAAAEAYDAATAATASSAASPSRGGRFTRRGRANEREQAGPEPATLAPPPQETPEVAAHTEASSQGGAETGGEIAPVIPPEPRSPYRFDRNRRHALAYPPAAAAAEPEPTPAPAPVPAPEQAAVDPVPVAEHQPIAEQSINEPGGLGVVPRRPYEGGVRPLRRERGPWLGDDRDPRRAAAGLPLAEPFRNRLAEQQAQQPGRGAAVPPNAPARNQPGQPGQPGQQPGRGAAPYMPGGRGQRQGQQGQGQNQNQGREAPPYTPAAGAPPAPGQPGYTPFTPYEPYAGYPAGAPVESQRPGPGSQNRPLRNRGGYGGQQGYPDQRQRGQQGRIPGGDTYRDRDNMGHGPNGRGGRLHGGDRRNDRRGSIGGRPREGRDSRDTGGYVPYPGGSTTYGVPGEGRYGPGSAGRPAGTPAVVRTVDVSGILWLDGGRGLGPAELLDHRTLLPIARLNPDDARRMGLRSGDIVSGRAEERGGRRVIVAVDTVNDQRPEEMQARPVFEQLTASFPDRRIRLEQGPQPVSARIIDLFAPLGFGSRALIVAPPKTGKTTLIREAAESVLKGYPNAVVMAVLVGERPEEVTDLRSRLEPAGGLVYAASFDEETQRHAWLVQVAVERAKRVAESGRDAFMVLDSLTRLARAENLASRGAGRTLSGGIDAQALDTGRRAFGAARNLEEGGSITILATCLVDTGSRQDDVVYEEFKGTGNMELHLSRELAQRRLFPAVDAVKSGTRREEMLLSPEELKAATALRRRLADLPAQQATQQLLGVMERTPSNAALIQAIAQTGWK